MSNVIDRVNRLEVYNQLLKKPYMTMHELARELDKTYEDIELYIASLRKMYKDGEVDKYVCASTDGYYLSDKYQNTTPTSKSSVIELNESTHNNFEKTQNSVNNGAHLRKTKNNDETLVLDFKKSANNNIKLLKVNIINDDDTLAFSLTVSLSQD